jgi:hypothetical protein
MNFPEDLYFTRILKILKMATLFATRWKASTRGAPTGMCSRKAA